MNRFVAMATVMLAVCCQAADYPSDLILYSKLDSAADIETPQIGAAGTDLGASFQAGKYGNALLGQAGSSHTAKLHSSVGLPVEKGSIDFWAKILNSKQSYSGSYDPLFVAFRKVNGDAGGRLSIDSNDGMGTHGLSLIFPYCYESTGSGYGGSYDYSTVYGAKDAKAWHHYAIVWNTNGIAGTSHMTRVYLDGEIVLSSDVSVFDPSFPVAMKDCEWILFGSGSSSVLIDEFRVWSTDRTTFPEGPVTPEDPTVVVSGVTAKQHYPWCGKIDIGYTVAGLTDGLKVKITVEDKDNGVTYEAKTFDSAPTAAAGVHTVVWDATKDGVNKVSRNMVATVSLIVPEE